MFMYLNPIASEQGKAISNTYESVACLLDCTSPHPDVVLNISASEMVLHINSDASYVCEPKSKSRAGGHYFLRERPIDMNKPTTRQPTNNGAIHIKLWIQRNVLASANKAEVGALFINGKCDVPLRTTLIKMDHHKPPTPIQNVNSTLNSIFNSSIWLRQSKAMDMILY